MKFVRRPRLALATLALGAMMFSSVDASAAPDPSTRKRHGWCYHIKTWSGRTARLYYPANGGCGASRYSPVVLFMHGRGYSAAQYHPLFKHLARNGYIVVAPEDLATDYPSQIEARANEAWDHMTDHVLTKWSKRAYMNTQRTVLMGHSQGGEGVRYLPARAAADVRFDIDAMVALAPTDFHGLPVTGVQTPAMLYLVGDLDEDIGAQPTYEVADRTGHSGSQLDPVPQPDALYRSFKLLHGGNHAGFAAPGPQMELTKGYVLAFLDAHARNDLLFYEDYIRGDAVPAAGQWSGGVTSQYRDGLLRRVIDDFDDGEIYVSTMSTTTQRTRGAASAVDLATEWITPHVAEAMRFDPPLSNAYVRWTLPPGRRDASAFKVLSLRVGQQSGPVTDDLWIQVRNFGQPMVERRLSDFGTIPQMSDFCPANNYCGIHSIQPLAHMGTIRIPLTEFPDVSDIRSVTLVARAEAVQGTFLIDDVELSEWIFAP